MFSENREFQPSQERQPEEGQPIEQKRERKPEEIIGEFESETELTKKRIEEIGKKIEEYKETKEENLGLGVSSSINEAIDKDTAILKEKRQEFVKYVEKRGPNQEEQKIKVEIQGIDAHIKIIQKVEEPDMPGMVPEAREAIKEGRKRDIEELEKQKKEKEKELQEQTLKRIEEYQKEKAEEGPKKETKEAPPKPEAKPEPAKPVEVPPAVVIGALGREIEETKEQLKMLEGVTPEGVAQLQELAKLKEEMRKKAEEITGRNFSQEARNELVQEGHYIDKEGKRWRVRRIPKEDAIKERIERITKAGREEVFKKQWEKLSDPEKAGHNNKIEDFKNKLEQQRRTLSRQTGVEISQDIFCKFLHSGKLQEVKKTSFLGLFRKRITVPIRQEDGTLKMKKYSAKDFREFVGLNQKRIEEKRREKAEEMWQEGQKVLAEAVAKKVEEKVKEVSEDIETKKSEKKYWEEVGAEARQKREKEEKDARRKYEKRLAELANYKKETIIPFLKRVYKINSFEDFQKRVEKIEEKIDKKRAISETDSFLKNLWDEYQKSRNAIEQDFQEDSKKVKKDFEDSIERTKQQERSKILEELGRIRLKEDVAKSISGAAEPKETEFSRRAAEITLARISNYQELWAETKEKGHQKFIEKTKELWKEFAVHGIFGTDKKTKEKTILNFTDLDGKCSLGLLRLAGINTRDVKYVAPGSFKQGRINLDTGDRYGLVVEDEGKTAFLDHHADESGGSTSATEITYKTLTTLGLLEKEDYLNRLVEFVTQVDNRSYPDEEKYFKDSWQTVLGLQRFINPEHLLEFFKGGRKPTEILSQADLRKYGLLERSQEQKKIIDSSFAELERMNREGLIVDSKRYGRIAVDEGKKVAAGFDVAKSYGCGGYIIWNPQEKSFFICTKKPLTDTFRQGRKVRETMWIKPRHDKTDLTITLPEILDKMTK